MGAFKLDSKIKNMYLNLTETDWAFLFKTNLEIQLQTKDIMILKLYFTFMAKRFNSKNTIFLSQCKKFFNTNKNSLS